MQKRIFFATQALCMRFDNQQPPDSAPEEFADFTPLSSSAVYQDLPESMKPKQVSADFTPFPLPKYDRAMGFGSVRLRNIPDIEASRQRMQEKREAPRSKPVNIESGEMLTGAFLDMEQLLDDGRSAGDGVGTAVISGVAEVSVSEKANETDTASVLGGYSVNPNFPYVDSLKCQRSVEDLLAQFVERPQREARVATVLDLAAIMHKCTNTEIEHIFYELGSIFAPDGDGLRFLACKVVKYGRPYFVPSHMTMAFVHLLETATNTFVVEQPHRLAQSPSLFIQLLHFMGLVKVLQPNLWFSPNSRTPQNRADYSHPRGVNSNLAHQHVGEELFDYMAELICDGPSDARSPFLAQCTTTQLLDLLAGFAGIAPDGRPEGKVTRAILRLFYERWARSDYELQTSEDVHNLERMYLILHMMGMKNDLVLHALLGRGKLQQKPEGMQREVMGTSGMPLRLHPELQRQMTRGPDFFSSVSLERCPDVLRCALGEFHRSFGSARMKHDEAQMVALAESGRELLMVLPDKAEAVRAAYEEKLDQVLLRSILGMEVVAERLALEEAQRLSRLIRDTHDVQAFLREEQTRYCPHYFTTYQGKPAHPIRTLLSDLFFVNSLDHVILLHSSLVKKSVGPLAAAVQRARGGKDALLITTACVLALETQLHYAVEQKQRDLAKRALEIVGYELEQGQAILVPFTEELLVHDAGTYCDEDLMLWTLAAFFSREMPLIKVHTAMSPNAHAVCPYHVLKGGHSPLTTSQDLYRKNTPLLHALRSKELRAVTFCAELQQPVRDRPSTLYYPSPVRARFIYRRDKALFDKYHVTSRNLALGFSQGALARDLRGLGFYTPDHPQVPYRPLPQALQRHIP